MGFEAFIFLTSHLLIFSTSFFFTWTRAASAKAFVYPFGFYGTVKFLTLLYFLPNINIVLILFISFQGYYFVIL